MKWIGQHIYDLAARFRGDVTIEGDLTVNGTYTQIDTDVTTTEQWLVTNDGTGPAAIINQKGSQDIFDVQDDGASVFYIEDGGNVGIGTTSPGYKLEVNGTGSFFGNIRSGGGTLWSDSNGGVQLGYSSTDSTGYLTSYYDTTSLVLGSGVSQKTGITINGQSASAGNQIFFRVGNAERMRITSAGNLGIGTTAPTEKLEVVGDIKLSTSNASYYLKIENNLSYANPFNLISAFGLEVLSVNSGQISTATNANANFGIGTSSPASKLHVAGTVQVGVDDTGHDVKFFGATSGKYIEWDESADCLRLADNTLVKFGYGNDLVIYHDGANNNITADNGNLTFTVNENDHDIIFKSDDGSGGTTAYLTLDGSEGRTVFSKHTRHLDNAFFGVGTGGDFTIDHDGSNTSLQNSTGDLYIKNYADDKDIIFQSDDGAGGLATYFSLDGGQATHSGSATTALYTIWPDKSTVALGSNKDLQLAHNGSESSIVNNTGNLVFYQKADDGDIIFQSDNGSGGLTPYLTLDGGMQVVKYSKNLYLTDNIQIRIGSGSDTQIYNDGSNFYIDNTTSDQDIIFKGTDGGADITALTLDMSAAGQANFNSHVYLPDAARVKLGAGHDLQMWHESNHSYIANATGNLTITNNTDNGDIIFQSDDGAGGVATYFKLDGSGAAHDGSATTSLTTNWPDNSKITLGTSNDLWVWHNGTNSFTDNYTGDFYIRQRADDKDIIFQSDDGSGGVETYFFLDGSVGGSVPYTVFPDNARCSFGNPGDGTFMELFHDGTNSYIENESGDLYIRNNSTDKDIILMSDDGSGGETAYLTLDGGLGYTTAQKKIRFDDNVLATFGTGNDLRIYHDGTNSFIDYNSGTDGNLNIRNTNDDKDIILQSDDGSGGTTAYLTLDGSATRTAVHKDLRFDDNIGAVFGSGAALKLHSDGSNGLIDNYQGNLIIRQQVDDADIAFQSDNGSGGVSTYFYLDGSLTETNFQVRTRHVDNAQAWFGNSGDLRIYHNGTNSNIENFNGTLQIVQNVDDGDISFLCDNGSGGTTAYLTLDGSDGFTKAHKKIRFLDNAYGTFGNADDLQIYHDGSNSFIKDTGTGDLYIDSSVNFFVRNEANKDVWIKGTDEGVSLRYKDNQKIITTNTGVSVTGDVIASGNIVDGATQIKVLPHHFMSNEDGGANKSAQFRDDTIIGVRTSADDAELYAFVEIPYGKTARTVTVYGNDTSLVVNVYESDINAGALTDKTPGAGCVVGTVCDITDVAYSATNYLVIKVTTVSYTNDVVYGAVVTIG